MGDVVGTRVGEIIGTNVGEVVGDSEGGTAPRLPLVGFVVIGEIVGLALGEIVGLPRTAALGEIVGLSLPAVVLGESDGPVVDMENVGEDDGSVVGSMAVSEGELEGETVRGAVVTKFVGDGVPELRRACHITNVNVSQLRRGRSSINM